LALYYYQHVVTIKLKRVLNWVNNMLTKSVEKDIMLNLLILYYALLIPNSV